MGSNFKKPGWFQDPGTPTGFISSKDRAEANKGDPSWVTLSTRGSGQGIKPQTDLKEPHDGSDDLDPYGNYYFALELGDTNGSTEVAHFLECSGLKSACSVFEIEEGGVNSKTHKRVERSKWENLVCRYATSTSTVMLEWRDLFLQDKFTESDNYKSGAITLKNNAGEIVRRYSFTKAWPVSWEGPSLSSDGSALSIETLELAHDGLTIDNK